jgi:hypothetical protein
MMRHHGQRAEEIERQILSVVDRYFEDGATVCRTITDRWLDLVENAVRSGKLPRRNEHLAALGPKLPRQAERSDVEESTQDVIGDPGDIVIIALVAQ